MTEPEFDVHGYPVLYDVRPYQTREGVLEAPAGVELTNGKTGRRFKVRSDFPLGPDYVADRDELTVMKQRARHAREARKK